MTKKIIWCRNRAKFITVAVSTVTVAVGTVSGAPSWAGKIRFGADQILSKATLPGPQPGAIQLGRSGLIVASPRAGKTSNFVGNWNGMRGPGCDTNFVENRNGMPGRGCDSVLPACIQTESGQGESVQLEDLFNLHMDAGPVASAAAGEVASAFAPAGEAGSSSASSARSVKFHDPVVEDSDIQLLMPDESQGSLSAGSPAPPVLLPEVPAAPVESAPMYFRSLSSSSYFTDAGNSPRCGARTPASRPGMHQAPDRSNQEDPRSSTHTMHTPNSSPPRSPAQRPRVYTDASLFTRASSVDSVHSGDFVRGFVNSSSVGFGGPGAQRQDILPRAGSGASGGSLFSRPASLSPSTDQRPRPVESGIRRLLRDSSYFTDAGNSPRCGAPARWPSTGDSLRASASELRRSSTGDSLHTSNSATTLGRALSICPSGNLGPLSDNSSEGSGEIEVRSKPGPSGAPATSTAQDKIPFLRRGLNLMASVKLPGVKLPGRGSLKKRAGAVGAKLNTNSGSTKNAARNSAFPVGAQIDTE